MVHHLQPQEAHVDHHVHPFQLCLILLSAPLLLSHALLRHLHPEMHLVQSYLEEVENPLKVPLFSIQRQVALARSFIKPERQLHFANSPN